MTAYLNWLYLFSSRLFGSPTTYHAFAVAIEFAAHFTTPGTQNPRDGLPCRFVASVAIVVIKPFAYRPLAFVATSSSAGRLPKHTLKWPERLPRIVAAEAEAFNQLTNYLPKLTPCFYHPAMNGQVMFAAKRDDVARIIKADMLIVPMM